MLDFTNKLISEEVILQNLISTACIKSKKGLDVEECSRRACNDIINGILLPNIREMEKLSN